MEVEACLSLPTWDPSHHMGQSPSLLFCPLSGSGRDGDGGSDQNLPLSGTSLFPLLSWQPVWVNGCFWGSLWRPAGAGRRGLCMVSSTAPTPSDSSAICVLNSASMITLDSYLMTILFNASEEKTGKCEIVKWNSFNVTAGHWNPIRKQGRWVVGCLAGWAGKGHLLGMGYLAEGIWHRASSCILWQCPIGWSLIWLLDRQQDCPLVIPYGTNVIGLAPLGSELVLSSTKGNSNTLELLHGLQWSLAWGAEHISLSKLKDDVQK